MFKKLVAFLVFLLALGTGLTLYLPRYLPSQSSPAGSVDLVSNSFKEPIHLDRFLVNSLDSIKLWGVQAGVFTDVDAARNYFFAVCSHQHPKVFKVVDRMGQAWYLAMLGPFRNEESMDSALIILRSSCRVSGLQTRWPLPKE